MSIDFTPVPVRARRDGWTPERQRAFVAALAERPNVAAACRAVGMSWQSAFRLRARGDAGVFAAAWDAAVAGPVPAASSPTVSGRALHGVATPITYRGRQVGERRRFDDRLAKYLLATHAPDRFGPSADAAPPRGPADRSAAFHAALAALESDLASGAAPSEGECFRGDVACTYSLSEPPR